MENRHGLQRDIPDGVKRAVRQRCGFGCIACGGLPIQYHHFDPPFVDATEHVPTCITLLCGCCHDKVTRGVWSDAKVRATNARPYGLTNRPHVLLDLMEPEILVVGTVIMMGRGPLLMVDGQELLRLDVREGEGGLLSARLHDLDGREVVVIRENELLAAPESWDINLVGSVFTLRNGVGDVVLEIRFYPPRGVHLRTLRMAFQGWRFDLHAGGKVIISSPSGGGLNFFDDATVVAGGLWRFDAGSMQMTGGVCLNPVYSAARFGELMEKGDFDALIAEITGPRAQAGSP